jgi:hypothetical protein
MCPLCPQRHEYTELAFHRDPRFCFYRESEWVIVAEIKESENPNLHRIRSLPMLISDPRE